MVPPESVTAVLENHVKTHGVVRERRRAYYFFRGTGAMATRAEIKARKASAAAAAAAAAALANGHVQQPGGNLASSANTLSALAKEAQLKQKVGLGAGAGEKNSDETDLLLSKHQESSGDSTTAAERYRALRARQQHSSSELNIKIGFVERVCSYPDLALICPGTSLLATLVPLSAKNLALEALDVLRAVRGEGQWKNSRAIDGNSGGDAGGVDEHGGGDDDGVINARKAFYAGAGEELDEKGKEELIVGPQVGAAVAAGGRTIAVPYRAYKLILRAFRSPRGPKEERGWELAAAPKEAIDWLMKDLAWQGLTPEVRMMNSALNAFAVAATIKKVGCVVVVEVGKHSCLYVYC